MIIYFCVVLEFGKENRTTSLMKIIALHEGSYSVDISKEFIPFDPTIHQIKDRPASLFIHVQPFLVKTANELIVLDTGLGYKDEQGELVIHGQIRQAGFDPGEVTWVLMSHLHIDHAGGMVFECDGQLRPSFPKATYVIQKEEWNMALNYPSASYNPKMLMVLQEYGCVQLVEGSGNLNEDIRYELTGGHCQSHQVFWIQERGEIVFFGGDVLPESVQLLRKFIAKYDFDGHKAMELRQEYGQRAAAEKWICLFYHARSNAIAQVAFEDQKFKILPI